MYLSLHERKMNMLNNLEKLKELKGEKFVVDGKTKSGFVESFSFVNSLFIEECTIEEIHEHFNEFPLSLVGINEELKALYNEEILEYHFSIEKIPLKTKHSIICSMLNKKIFKDLGLLIEEDGNLYVDEKILDVDEFKRKLEEKNYSIVAKFHYRKESENKKEFKGASKIVFRNGLVDVELVNPFSPEYIENCIQELIAKTTDKDSEDVGLLALSEEVIEVALGRGHKKYNEDSLIQYTIDKLFVINKESVDFLKIINFLNYHVKINEFRIPFSLSIDKNQTKALDAYLNKLSHDKTLNHFKGNFFEMMLTRYIEYLLGVLQHGNFDEVNEGLTKKEKLKVLIETVNLPLD